MSKLDEVKSELLGKAADVAAHSPLGAVTGDVASTKAFLARYYRHVAPEDLVGRDPVDVLGAALSQRQLAQQRPQGTANVRVFTPSVEEHGWASGHTIVEVVTDDMPFLVDSVTAELVREQRSMYLVVHPQLVVRRDITGTLLEVCEPGDDDDSGEGDRVVESWMHLEIDRETEPEDLEKIHVDLLRVLRDVREAVEDWEKMRGTARRVADEIEQACPVCIDPAEAEEATELLRWLADDHFTFLGYREYTLSVESGDELRLDVVPGSGLGILRDDPVDLLAHGKLSAEAHDHARDKQLLVLTKANSRSTVHRSAFLDYVGVKMFDDKGEVVGERRFLGLFTSVAYNESIEHIPVLRRKAMTILERSGFSPTSHSGKDLFEILETYPRDELFQVSVDELESVAMSVLHLRERRQLRLFLRRDLYGRFVSALVYLPRDRYTTAVRLQMADILSEAFDATGVDYTARVSESILARLHFVVRVAPGTSVRDVDAAELEQRLVDATRSWSDDFGDALVDAFGEERAATLVRNYGDAFPEAYKEDFPARTGVADLERFDRMGDDDTELGMSLYEPLGAAPGEKRFKLYRNAPLSLSAVLPVLQNMGAEVVDERPYELERRDGRRMWIYDFGLRFDPTSKAAPEQAKHLFQQAFEAVWRGAAENDRFNALVLRAGLDWRQVSVLRAYAKYLRQGGTTFSQDYIEQCLTANVPISKLLVRLFEAAFDPAYEQASAEVVDGIVEEVEAALDAVASLDQDRILRSFLGTIRATLRTNYFQTGADGQPKPYISFKLDPQRVPDLPAPRPRFEIWVYSPRVEGVHLRFGSVARGGLRWSDRREDFRTEILGLVKAQTVKNAVIVPTGAKGGFVVKQPPADASDREAVLAEGVACYQTFIRGLLDITDNRVEGNVLPPPRVVRRDGDDPYLVVAADKGTAAFSDIANGVAAEYDFWLGDAFASGGSAGYDHKVMGITARGAWESVKRHFREMGRDTQTQDFTVVGIGDMSGDVFGNGMLLSEHIQLVCAFDHRHVFLDPTPDAATSYAERRRMFDLPRSSWADYDTALISAGGGVFPRTAKSIVLTPQVRKALGIADNVSKLSPAELIKAALQAPVDLLWNGGIGTYVKAGTESHADVGDKANDAVRVDGAQVRARVIGEGGNLGCTQLGRIEYGLLGAGGLGGRINTDAIDNSAGVDTSDHEVNIKVLLDEIVREGDLTEKQRNALLVEMTDEVASLVLADNYEQNVLLGNARRQAHSMLPVHKRFIRHLERLGDLDRELEFLPSDSIIDQRHAAGAGLTSSEFSVLVAYSKISLTEAITESPMPDEPWFQRALRGYFPHPLVDRYDERLERHPLRREIITTCVSNDLVNRAGITFVFRASEESGATAPEITRAYTVAREIFRFEDYWSAIEGLDTKVATDAQTGLYLEGRRLLDRSTRWLLQSRRAQLDVAGEIEHFAEAIADLMPRIPDLLQGVERERLVRRAADIARQGVPDDLARHAAGLLDAFSLLDVVEIASVEKAAPPEVASIYFAASERFEVDRLLTRITALPRDDRWQALARSSLRYDLYSALAGLTAGVLSSTDPTKPAVERIEEWEQQNAEGFGRAQATLREISEVENPDLATLSVAMRTIRTLLRTSDRS